MGSPWEGRIPPGPRPCSRRAPSPRRSRHPPPSSRISEWPNIRWPKWPGEGRASVVLSSFLSDENGNVRSCLLPVVCAPLLCRHGLFKALIHCRTLIRSAFQRGLDFSRNNVFTCYLHSRRAISLFNYLLFSFLNFDMNRSESCQWRTEDNGESLIFFYLEPIFFQ